jgi:hypothetical protein
MILHWFVTGLLGLLTPVLTALSFATVPIGDLSGAVTLGSAVGQANRYLPVDQFLLLIVAGLAFDLALTGAQFFLFLYRLIPGKAT